MASGTGDSGNGLPTAFLLSCIHLPSSDRISNRIKHLRTYFGEGPFHKGPRGFYVSPTAEHSRESIDIGVTVGAERYLGGPSSGLPKQQPDLHALDIPRVIHQALDII